MTLQYILHYIILYYITLRYITLHYIPLHYITVHYITLDYITVHYTSLHYLTLHEIVSYQFTLGYIAIHYITLRYIGSGCVWVVRPPPPPWRCVGVCGVRLHIVLWGGCCTRSLGGVCVCVWPPHYDVGCVVKGDWKMLFDITLHNTIVNGNSLHYV